MVVLIIGGSGSGKSAYAEKRCMELAPGKKLYIATMQSMDAESDARIAKHRRLRSGKDFETLECQTHLEEADIPIGATVLLECMSNLVANEMFSMNGRGRRAEFSKGKPMLFHPENQVSFFQKNGNHEKENLSPEADAETVGQAYEKAVSNLVMCGVRRLCNRAEHTVIVTNQVFSDGISYDLQTEEYLRVLATINADIAQLADEVVEVVHGIPVFLKS